MSGCDCALELAMEGKEVTIVEMQEALCPTALLDNRNPLLFKLEDYHVEQLCSTKIEKFTESGVIVSKVGQVGEAVRGGFFAAWSIH